MIGARDPGLRSASGQAGTIRVRSLREGKEAMSIKPWATKAHRLIGILCDQSYRQANPKPKIPGTRQKHKPYQVPQLAADLVRCLNTDNEREAKEIFLSYDGIELLKGTA